MINSGHVFNVLEELFRIIISGGVSAGLCYFLAEAVTAACTGVAEVSNTGLGVASAIILGIVATTVGTLCVGGW